mgnify:CR=1 FL=1
MTKNSKLNTNEIDLIELMLVVWKGKWKIAVVVVISFISMMSHRSIQPNNFTAMTEIKPVKTLEMNKYINFNNLILANNFNFIDDTADNIADDTVNDIADDTADDASKIKKGITKSLLLGLYIDIMNDRSVFEEAMRKFNILDVSQYNNDQEYKIGIIQIASSVRILKPLDNYKKKNLENYYNTINFTYDDVEKWKNILKYTDELANKLVKKTLVERYNKTLLYLKKKKNYQIEDIKIIIENIQKDSEKDLKEFELKLGYQLEDVQAEIENALIDYNRNMKDRMAFLREQASIARELKIANNTIEIQPLNNQYQMLQNIKTESPFYLRGYVAIEKEIQLIELRNENVSKSFVDKLFVLEQKKRTLEQDKTLLRAEKNNDFLEKRVKLEKQLREIEQDNTIKRLESVFQSTPLADNKEFSSASISVYATKFRYNENNQSLAIAVVIGLIAGIFYVLVSNTLQSHRVSRKKTN